MMSSSSLLLLLLLPLSSADVAAGVAVFVAASLAKPIGSETDGSGQEEGKVSKYKS